MTAESVLSYWFEELDTKDWFIQNDRVDNEIRARFSLLHTSAAAGELYDWRSSMAGRLAEIILLDQFSRNLFRDDARAFSYDPLALVLSQEAISLVDKKAIRVAREKTIIVADKTGGMSDIAGKEAFLYMPFLHSESRAVHEVAIALFSQPGMEQNLEFELKHKVIIDRFGRYPHRNKILERTSTPEEIEFLKQEGSSF